MSRPVSCSPFTEDWSRNPFPENVDRSERGDIFGLRCRGKKKTQSLAVVFSPADDLTEIIDSQGYVKHPARVRGEKIIKILHLAVSVQKSVLSLVTGKARADYPTEVLMPSAKASPPSVPKSCILPPR